MANMGHQGTLKFRSLLVARNETELRQQLAARATDYFGRDDAVAVFIRSEIVDDYGDGRYQFEVETMFQLAAGED
jgi:hypothetical protein